MNTSPARSLHLLANNRSGRGRGSELADIAQKICDEHGVTLVRYDTTGDGALEKKTDEAISAARKNPNDIVVAAGGDGTLRLVAEKVFAAQVTFAVVPCGTFNFFARANQIPEDHAEAIRLAVTGKPQPVRLGEINQRIFLINASLGLYAKSIEEREESTDRFGRARSIVILSTIKTLLKRHRLLHVTFQSAKGAQEFRTPMIFIGNNALQLRNVALPVAACMKEHKLALVLLKPVRGLEMARVILRGIAKTLRNEERLHQFCVGELRIIGKRKHEHVALDGEMFEMKSPFDIRSLPAAIQMIKPPAAE